MSISRRKITYYSIEFMQGDHNFFNKDLFCKFMRYLREMNNADRIFNDINTNKAITIWGRGSFCYKTLEYSNKLSYNPIR